MQNSHQKTPNWHTTEPIFCKVYFYRSDTFLPYNVMYILQNYTLYIEKSKKCNELFANFKHYLYICIAD